jgi:hypothetical protein
MQHRTRIVALLVVSFVASCGRDQDVSARRAQPDGADAGPLVEVAGVDAAPDTRRPAGRDFGIDADRDGAVLVADVTAFGLSPKGTGMVRVSNVGTRPTGPITLRLVGNAQRAFAITDAACQGVELAPGALCTAAVSTTDPPDGVTSGFATLSIAASPGGSANVTYDVRRGLATRQWIGHWKFDGDARDASGRGNEGTVRAGQELMKASAVVTPTYVEGHDGQAILLDGTQWIEVPHAESLDEPSANGEFTIAAWVRPDEVAPSGTLQERQQWIFTQQEEGSPYSRLGLMLLDGAATCAIQFSWAKADAPIASGRWVHVAAVYDGLTCVVYHDGEPAGSLDIGWPIRRDVTPLVMGTYGYPDVVRGFFRGALDDVRLANRAMPPWTIRALAGR